MKMLRNQKKMLSNKMKIINNNLNINLRIISRKRAFYTSQQ